MPEMEAAARGIAAQLTLSRSVVALLLQDRNFPTARRMAEFRAAAVCSERLPGRRESGDEQSPPAARFHSVQTASQLRRDTNNGRMDGASAVGKIVLFFATARRGLARE